MTQSKPLPSNIPAITTTPIPTISTVKQVNPIAGGRRKRYAEVRRHNDDPIQDILDLSKFNSKEVVEKPLDDPIRDLESLIYDDDTKTQTNLVATPISAAKQLVSHGTRKKRYVDFIQPNDDPIHDLEMTKFNLKKFIYDENKNDINLLHNLEEKLKNKKKEKLDISLLKVKLFNVVQLLLIDAHKAGIKRPEAIFIKAIKTAEIEASHPRKRRSVNVADNIHKVDGKVKRSKLEIEQRVLAQIFRELDDLKMFSAAKKGSLQSTDEKSIF